MVIIGEVRGSGEEGRMMEGQDETNEEEQQNGCTWFSLYSFSYVWISGILLNIRRRPLY